MDTIPFYSNTEDDTHCFQASMRMILEYFIPGRTFSFEELDTMSAKVSGMSTWPQQMLINLADMGMEVVMIEGFDGKAFIAEGGEYLKRAFGTETADWQIANSDIDQEQKLYEQLLNTQNVYLEHRIPQLSEIKKYLKDGYLINTVVNSRKLNGKDDYVGHSILVYEMDDNTVTFHDPGLPAQRGRCITLDLFQEAWADPNETAQNLIAIKPKERS